MIRIPNTAQDSINETGLILHVTICGQVVPVRVGPGERAGVADELQLHATRQYRQPGRAHHQHLRPSHQVCLSLTFTL
jgi:hypothetical protein